MKGKILLPIFLAVLFSLSGCGFPETSGSETSDTAETGETTAADEEETAVTADASEMFTDRDLEVGYDQETSVRITLTGDSASCDSDAVQISGSTVTVTEEGTYILSGSLKDGSIVVNAGDTDKIQLVLDGVEITSSTSAVIYVSEADKVFLTTASGSENTLANGGEYTDTDDNHVDGVIFSKSDLTLNGEGKLTVLAEAGHGIVSKDDLALTSGTYEITAERQGLSGKDSVRIANGTYTITSGKDGIHAENTEDTSLGFLYISGGTFTITADGDGISASGYLQLEDGSFTITTGQGSSSVTMVSDSMEPGQRGGFREDTAAAEEEDSVSQKGIKAEGTMIITNGDFVTDTVDDSVHAGGDLLIRDGSFSLQSGDDAIHSDGNVTVQGGNFAITYCYEGIEGLTVTIDDGVFDIEAVDDGINAAGGADSSGFGGGRPGQDAFSASSDSFITINSGEFVIVSDGDCVDSNGALTINGGTLDLTCSGNGNTALDCDGTYTCNGGDITTNDGSEENPGQMGGGQGGRDGQGEMEPPDRTWQPESQNRPEPPDSMGEMEKS